MVTYKTPGVYVEEISTLPPSVAEVSTAIPAFIGYTAAGKKVARISTLLEYETAFGKAKTSQFKATTQTNADTGYPELVSIERDTTDTDFLMYYSLSYYFKNGGGTCYIVSVGDYSSSPAKADFEAGLADLEKEDEPTLIILTDALNLASVDYYDLCQQALGQCNKLGDRFAILDVVNGNDKVAEFRNSIGTNYLMYGAAYHPYLQTTLTYNYVEDDVQIQSLDAPASAEVTTWQKTFGDAGIAVTYTGSAGDDPKVKIVGGTAGEAIGFDISETKVLTISNVSGETGASVVAAWGTWKGANDTQGFDVAQNGDGSGDVPHTSNANVDLEGQATVAPANTLSGIRATNTALYNQIRTALTGQRIVLPPSAGIAGVYTSVDRERGVWKAPANVSLAATIGPVTKITHEQQEALNVDPTAGKSINAIRAFTGKGTLVWGARTLAGNDNEWRYISVRRLFNMIEESTQKATAFAVFEPNDTTTWLKVKAMIESYLYGLWEQGGLAGSTPEAAYFVNVGLGKTMTNQDILEGRMIVEIGVAAVRPAEFIVLRFTHKMQEA